MSIDFYAKSTVDQNNQPINLYDQNKNLTYDPETLSQKVEKTNYALGTDSPGITSIQASIGSGNESYLRDYAAKKDEINIVKQKQGILQEYMASKDHPVTPDEMHIILSLSKDEMSNPDTVIEKLFSKNIVNDLHDQIHQDLQQTEDEVTPQEQDANLHNSDVAQFQLQRNQSAITYLQELKAQADKQPLTGKIWDKVQDMAPFVQWWDTQNVVNTNQSNPFLMGDNWAAQSAYLHMQRPEKFNSLLREAGDHIAKYNVDEAMAFTSYVLAHGSSDTMMNNMFSLSDIADVGSSVIGTAAKIGKGLVRTVKVSKIDSALKDVVKAASEPKIDPTNVVAATGDTERAAEIQVVRNSKTKLLDADQNFRGSGLWDSVTSITNPKAITTRPAQLAGELSRRLQESVVATARKAQAAITDISMAQRLSREAEAEAVSKAKDLAMKEFDHPNSTILDIVHVTPDKANLGNIHEIEVKLGKPDGTLFRRSTDANKFADKHLKLPTGSYNVKQNGNRFYLSVTRDVPEADGDVLSHQIDLQTHRENVAPNSHIANFMSLLGYAGNADNLTSALSRMNRHTVTHASQEFNRYTVEIAKSLNTLGYRQRKKLNSFLNANRDWHTTLNDKKTGEAYIQRGRFFDNQSDFENAWHDAFNEYPSLKVSQAYHSFHQLNDVDYVVRNLSIYRDLARQGAMDHQIIIGDKTLDWFKGREVKSVPTRDSNPDDAGILTIDHDTGNVSYETRNNMTNDQLSNFHEKVNKDGYKIIQTADPSEVRDLLKDHTNGVVNFIVVKDSKKKPLEFQQIPYNPGGHVENPQGWIVKQPVISTSATPISGSDKSRIQHVYHGDRAAWIFGTEAEANKYSALLNKAASIPLNNSKALKNFLANDLDGIMTRQEFNRMFTAIGNTPAKFDRKVPFHAVERNTSVEEKLRGTSNDLKNQYPGIISTQSSSYNMMREVSKEFTGPRDLDLKTIKELPTGMRLQPADKIDSLEMMTKSVQGLTQDRWFKDYQYQAVSSYFRQFANAFDQPIQELQKNALYYLHHPPYSDSTSKFGLRAQAEVSRRAIVTFMSQQTATDKMISYSLQKIASSVYEKMGQKASDFATGFNVVKIDDPFKRMRAIAFHPKLGLFNPIQILTNSQTLFHMSAITGNPARVYRAQAAAYFMHIVRSAAMDHMEHYAQQATHFGWTKEGFLDSWDNMRKTGWDQVGGEINTLDNVTNGNMFKGKKMTSPAYWLDKGTAFFRHTEQNNRLVAWNIAYKEFRRDNPTRVIGDRERADILTRADTLNLNSTRASNTSLQRGVFSLPLQFYAYNQRLMEQMIGKQLTVPEKARVFAMYTALYGVPGATGVGGLIGGIAGVAEGTYVYGTDPQRGVLNKLGNIALEGVKGAISPAWPFYDDIKEAALARGMDLNNGIIQALVEGIPAVLLEGLFGGQYNVGQRYGPGGAPVLRDALSGDKSLPELAFGVSGSVVADMMRNFNPIFMGLTDVFSDDSEKYPLTFQDFVDLGKNFSSLNQVGQTLAMINSGKYITKHGLYVQDVDMWDALAYGFLGLTPRSIGDTFLAIRAGKEKNDMQDKAKADINMNFKRAFTAISQGDHETAVIYFKKARALAKAADFRPDELGGLLSDAIQSTGSLKDNIDSKFFLQDAPASQQQQRQDYYLNREGNQ